MYTNTSKQILSPLAEAVFQLILTISDAEINDDPIPDLTQLARMVDDQTLNLVSVGTKIQNQPTSDEFLKVEMPKACQEVTKASTLLIGATTELKENPRSKHGAQSLLESVKGILSGTTNVLKAFDDFEVRKIIILCQACAQRIRIIHSDQQLPPQQLVNLLMQISQAIVQLAQVTNKRVSELLQPVLQSRLRIAVSDLTKESPLLITSSKAFLQNSRNTKAKEARNQSCMRLLEACKEIETVVQIQTEEELTVEQKGIEGLKIVSKQSDSYQVKLVSGLRPKDTTTYTALGDYISANNSFLKIGKDVIQNWSHPREKDRLQKVVADLETTQPLILQASNNVMKNTDNGEARATFGTILIESRQKMDAFLTELSQGPNSLKLTATLVAEKQRQIVQGIKNRDIASVHTAILEYNNITKTNAQLAKAVVEAVLQPKEKKKLEQAVLAMDANQETFLHETQTALASENIGLFEKRLEKLIETSHNTAKEIEAAVEQTVDSLLIARDLAEAQQSKLLATLTAHDTIHPKVVEDYLVASKDYITMTKGKYLQSSLSLDICQSLQDPVEKKKIEVSIIATENSLRKLGAQTQSLLSHPHDETTQIKFSQLLNEHKKQTNQVHALIKEKNEGLKAISKVADDQQAIFLSNLKEKNVASAMPTLENYLSCNKIVQEIALGQINDNSKQLRFKNIMADIDSIQKSISKQAVESIMNPEDAMAAKKLEKMMMDTKFKVLALQDGLNQHVAHIENQKKVIDSQRLEVASGLKTKDAVVATSVLHDYIATNEKFVEKVRDLVDDMSPSSDTDYLKTLAAETEASLKQVEKLTKQAVNDPHNDQVQRDLHATFTDHKIKVALIQSELSQNHPEVKKMVEHIKSSEVQHVNLVSSLRAKNITSARASYNHYMTANKSFLETLKALPEVYKNESIDYDQAKSKAVELEDLQTAIINQANKTFQNPKDEESQQKLIALIDISRDKISEAQMSVAQTPKQLKYLSVMFDEQQVKILEGVHVDVEAYNQAVGRYLESAEKFVEISKGLVEKAKYSKDGELLKPMLNDFEVSLDLVKAKAREAVQQPNNKQLQQELSTLFEDNKNLMSTLQNQLNAKLEPFECHVKSIEENSIRLVQSAKTNDVSGVVDAVNASDFEHEALAHLTEEIISKIEDEAQKEKLSIALEELHIRTDKIHEAAKVVLEESGNTKKQRVLSKLVDVQIKKWVSLQSDIRKALVGELALTAASLSTHTALDTVLGRQMDAASKGKAQDMGLLNKEFQVAFNRVSELTNIAITMVSSTSPQVASDLELQRTRLERLGPSVVTAADALAANPKDEGVKEFARGIISAWEETMKEIHNATIGQEEMVLKNQFDSLEKSFVERDVYTAHRNALTLVTSASQFIATAKKEIENTTDPSFRSLLEENIHSVEHILPQLVSKSNDMLQHASDPVHVEKVAETLHSSIKETIQSLGTLGSIIKDSKVEEEDPEESIVDSYANQPLRPSSRRGSKLTSRVVEALEVAILQTNLEEEQVVGEASLVSPTLEPFPRRMSRASKVGRTSVTVAEKPMENRPVLTQLSPSQLQEQIMDKQSPLSLAQKLAIVTQMEEEEEDAVYVDEDAPQLLSEQEAAENPLKAVAVELMVEVSGWASDGNPIVKAAEALSGQMETLSRYHIELRFSTAPETKKGFINAAKDVLTIGHEIDVPARALAEQCTDLRLKRQLIQTIDRISTIAQQLKIVAAVKAASPKDTDRDQQLILCAQNLMLAVKTCLRNCEVASIRINKMAAAAAQKAEASLQQPPSVSGSFKTATNFLFASNNTSATGSPRISFRKKVYRGRSRAGTVNSQNRDIDLSNPSSPLVLRSPMETRFRSRTNTMDTDINKSRSRTNTLESALSLRDRSNTGESPGGIISFIDSYKRRDRSDSQLSSLSKSSPIANSLLNESQGK